MKRAWRWTPFLGLLAVAFNACSADGDHSQTTYRYYAFAIDSSHNSRDNAFLYSLSAFRIDATTGALMKVSETQLDAPPTPHSLAVGPSGRFLYVASLGDPGHVRTLEIDAATGELNEVAGSPFAAGICPAAVAFHPSGLFAYVTDAQYMGVNQPGVSAFLVNAMTGGLAEIPGTRVDINIPWRSSILVSPSGKVVYVAGYDQEHHRPVIFAFDIDRLTGALTEMTGSPFAVRVPPPTNLTLGTALTNLSVGTFGKFVFGLTSKVWNSNSFLIDPRTGSLTETALSPLSMGSEPYGLAVEPSGRFVYMLISSGIIAYTIDEDTGALTEVTGSPFVASWPKSISVDPSGKFVYVGVTEMIGGLPQHSIRVFLLNVDTGALIEQAGSSLAVDHVIMELIVIRTTLLTW